MDELRTRFLILDRVPVPELWADIERRAGTAAAGAGGARVTVRAPWLDGSVRAGARRSTLASLVWAALLGLLLIGAIALGGLIAGAWSLDDFRVVVPPTPIPCEPGAGPGQQTVFVEDQTRLVAGCAHVGGNLVGGSLGGNQVEVTNPANDLTRLEIKWIVAGCDVSATVVFKPVGNGYVVRVEDRQRLPCGPGTALQAVEIQLRRAVPASTVSGTVTRE